jgi:hypothetical protein
MILMTVIFLSLFLNDPDDGGLSLSLSLNDPDGRELDS